MAARGLFSFNALLLTMRPVGYFRVADPVAPLRLESLPTNIRAILEKTRLKRLSFRESDVIQLEAIQLAELAS
jgi:hypothetical protein